MDQKICKNCAHFQQHYSFNRQKIFRVYCGHCTLRTAKKRNPDAVACEEFTSGPADEEAFATKDYLSKALLEYMFSLELLPEIAEAPGYTKQQGDHD